jgi:hypothetical protein
MYTNLKAAEGRRSPKSLSAQGNTIYRGNIYAELAALSSA